MGDSTAELFFGIDIGQFCVEPTIVEWACRDIKARGLPFLKYHTPNETVDVYIMVDESHRAVEDGGKSVGSELVPDKEWLTALDILMNMLHIEGLKPSYFIVGHRS